MTDQRPRTDSWSGDSYKARLQHISVEWYTPARYIIAVHTLMGGIDCDPASNALANKVVRATTYYDKDTNGLDKSWSGRVFMNPPYGKTGILSNQEIWTCCLIAQYEAGVTQEAVVLVNASTDTRWFQRLWVYPICFVDHRVNFYSVDGGNGGATHGNVFVYLGQQEARFIEIFSQFGVVVKRVSAVPTQLWDASQETDEYYHDEIKQGAA